MDDGLRYSFQVWFGDEHTTVLWTTDMNAGRNTSPPTWAAFLEDAIVDAFNLPRGSRLSMAYQTHAGTTALLTRDAAYDKFWESLPRAAHHASTGKHGRLDVRRVDVDRADPAMCQISLGGRHRLFWCSLDDSAWDDIQLGVAQAFGLSKGSRVVFSVIDDEGDEITRCDPFAWRILLSLIAIAPQSGKPVQIQVTAVNGSAASPLDSTSTIGPAAAIGDSRTLIPLPYLGASKVRFFVGQTRAAFWFRNVHNDPDAWLVNLKVLWARAASVLSRPQSSPSSSTLPEMCTFDHKGRLVTLATPLCWRTYAAILGTYDKPFRTIEMHLKPAGADAITPPTAPPAAGMKGSRFQIRAVGPDTPVLVFVHRQALHIAVWPRQKEDDFAQEWTKVQAHVKDLFKVPALAGHTLSYVDAEHHQQMISSPESWEKFVEFARADVNKIRIVSLAQPGETPTATTRPPPPLASPNHSPTNQHITQMASPPPTPQVAASISAARRARVSMSTSLRSAAGSSRSIAFDPPPAYAQQFGNASTSSILTQKAPMRSPPPSRSPPAAPIGAPPSSPLPPIPTASAPSLPPIAPLSPITDGGDEPAPALSHTERLERELAEAREEIARLREGRDRSTETIMHLTAELARLVQENAALQKIREAASTPT
ncbi:hypothetical protein AURDEDRAFT_112155 [Auricularia subglabra TFB-10046 SS5]|nr:hypothetical protein AURDEDRAFT_112155 [Auricularia subglabra TFB-10046 SS5]